MSASQPILSRRFLLRSAALVPLVAAGCASRGSSDVAPADTMNALTSTDGIPGQLPDAKGAFGPDGSHWPSNTIRPGGGRSTIDVECTWEAIRSALAAVTADQAAAGTHIRVAPGELPGFGGGNGARAVLENVGDPRWQRNALVTPRDGWGSISIADGARLRKVQGVTFARINATFVLLADCTRTNWVQSKVSLGFRMVANQGTVTECDAYEVVMPVAKADISDPFGFAASAGATLKDSEWVGCYAAPVFRPKGASDHIDTLQMYGDGIYRGLVVRDSTLFGGLNSALQLGGTRPSDPDLGTPFVTLEHSIIASQEAATKVRYSVPAGAQAPTSGQAINGAGEPGNLHAYSTFVLGSMYTTKWGTVKDSYVSYVKAPANNPAREGGWIYDQRLSLLGPDQFDKYSPEPTDAYLASIWA